MEPMNKSWPDAEAVSMKSAVATKPWPVRLVEVQALAYVVFAVAGWLLMLCGESFSPTEEFWLSLIFALCTITLTACMYLAVRQDRYEWFLLPNLAILLPPVLAELIDTKFLAIDILPTLAFSALAAVPILLLSLPASQKWRRKASANRKKGNCGCPLAVTTLWLMGVVAGVFYGSSSSKVHVAVKTAVSAHAHQLHKGMVENMLSREGGEDWIDPSTCSNSTQFIVALLGKRTTEIGHYTNIWSIAVNPPDDDKFPIIVSCNIDIAELLCPQNEEKQVSLTCPKEWGGQCFKLCEKFFILVQRDGAAQVIRARHRTPRQIFYGRMPKPGPNTYFLTPTGRVDFVSVRCQP